MRRAWLLGALVILAGCRIGYSIDGDESFLRRDIVLVPGRTTALEVAQALGPPQLVTSRSGDLIYHYRLRETFHLSATVRYFSGQWLQGSLDSSTDQSLIVVFGPQDRLRYVAPSQGSGDQFAVAPVTSVTPSVGAE